MSKEKLPPEEGREDAKGYIEIDLSRVKDKMDEGLERVKDAVDHGGRKYMVRDVQAVLEKDRVGLDPSLFGNGYGMIVCVAVMWVVCAAAKASPIGYLLCGLLLLPAAALILLGKYEIRYGEDGFSVRLGKKELRRYTWSDVTDATGKNKVFVNGKRLFADSSMYGFDAFYHRARAACKSKGKPTPASERKRRNRKKQAENNK